jgi:hypothetical protein
MALDGGALAACESLWGRRLRYSLNRCVIGCRVPLGRCGKDINLLPVPGIEPGYLGVPAIALLISRLSYPGHHVPPTLSTTYQTTQFHSRLVPPTRLHGSITPNISQFESSALWGFHVSYRRCCCSHPAVDILYQGWPARRAAGAAV